MRAANHIETETKQETEVDIINEEEMKQGHAASSLRQRAPTTGIPLGLKIKSGTEFNIENGRIESLLYKAHEKGNARESKLISLELFAIDTIAKKFGRVGKKGQIDKIELQPQFTVDAELSNPQKLSEFILRKTVVPLPAEAKCPFAVLSGSQVFVFWTQSQTYRDYWVKAFRSLCDPNEEAKVEAAHPGANGQLELSEDNWYASQIYMFLKREHTIFGVQATRVPECRYEQNNNQDQDGEGGGEPASNAEEEEEKKSKAFSFQTVSNDQNQIKGYLYKTAQSLGLLQSHYFLRRYYVLNKQTATLTVHDKPGGKADNSVVLTDCLKMVDTNLNTFLKPDFQQHFKENVSKLQLPKDNPLPFALFIKDKMAILWAATDADYDLWTTAFQQCQSMPVESEAPIVESVRNNRFVTSLVSALRNEPIQGEPRQVSRPRVHSVDARRDPMHNSVRNDQPLVSYQSSTMVVQENVIEGKLMKTSQRLSKNVFNGVSTEYFLLRRYKLDLATKTMYIMRLGKNKPDLTINFNEQNSVTAVDDRISSQLVINYLSFFKRELKSGIVIPQDYQFPLVVKLGDNQVMMLWIASEFERSVWAKQFRALMLSDQERIDQENVKIQTTDANEFIATLYRCLVPYNERNKQITAAENKSTATGYKIRIIQQGLLLKTSQKAGGVLQKKNFHMRFFNLNVSTGTFKVFMGMTPDGKVKHSLDLRNKVLAVTALIPKLDPACKLLLRQYKVQDDFMLPHDFKMPFAVVYEDDYKGAKLGVMILWAQTDKIRQQWIEAFKYITVENSSLLRKDVPIPAQIDIHKHNFFCVILFQHLEMPQVDEDSNDGVSNVNHPGPQQRQDQMQKIKETKKCSPDQQKQSPIQPKKVKKQSEIDLIEQAWERYKTETPVETLISGQTTFQIQSKCSMGLIRARKELFDNNYDPETVVKCFLLINFDYNLIGIRSVDSTFSAMVQINGTDLVHLQDNFSFVCPENSSIDLVMATNKVLQISANHSSEHSLIFNELNRAKIMSGQGRATDRAEAEDTASNQQQESQQDLIPSIQHSATAVEQIQQPGVQEDDEDAMASEQALVSTREQSMKQNKHKKKFQVLAGGIEVEENEPIGPSSPTLHNDHFQRNWSSVRQSNMAGAQQRPGRFAREDPVVVIEETRGNRTRKMRQNYADEMNRDSGEVSQQLANNQQDLDPTSPLLGRGNAPMRPAVLKDQKKAQVIPLNKIKFSGGAQETPKQQFKMTPKMRNSFMNEQPPSEQTSQQNSVIIERITRQSNAGESSMTKMEGVDFFQPQSAKNRENAFAIPQSNPSSGRNSMPIKIKLSKKRPTEDSKVRQSLQQSAVLNNTVTGKIDFHSTTSFRDAFPDAGASGRGPKPMRPSIASDGNPENYEIKIQASRDQGFIDNLITQQAMSGQQSIPIVGNRFMSPAVRHSINKSMTQPVDYSEPFNSQPANHLQSANAGYSEQPYSPQKPPAFAILAADESAFQHQQPASQANLQQDKFNYMNQEMPQRLNTSNLNFTQPVTVGPAKRSMTHDRGGAVARGQARKDDDLSDWDDDSGDEFAAKPVKQPLTQVRDRPVSLSNVYHGLALSPKGRDTQQQQITGQSAQKWFSNHRERKPSQNDNDLEVEDWD